MAVQDRTRGLLGTLGVKAPVLVATTTAVTLSGEQTIDGVAVVAEDRVLVKDQSDTTTNGIYYCRASTWVRAPDFDGTRDALQGTLVVVASGTTNASTLWTLTTADPVIGTSNLTFSVFAPLTASAFIQTLLDDTTAAAARTTLGTVGLTGNETIAGNKTFSGQIIPAPLIGIVGTTSNDSVATGAVGEIVTSTVLAASAVSLTTATAKNVTSISLTAGDWDVTGGVGISFAASTTVTVVGGAVSTDANTMTLPRTIHRSASYTPGAVTAEYPVVEKRVSVASTTTVYLIGYCEFGTSTAGAFGVIRARRIR